MKKQLMLVVGFTMLCVGVVSGRMAWRDRKAAAQMRPQAPEAKREPAPAAAQPLTMEAAKPSDFEIYEPTQGALEPTVDIAEACSSEIGLLCHSVPAGKEASCLKNYAHGLMKECRDGMEARGYIRDL